MSGEVPRIGMPAFSSASASFSGVWPPNCTMTPSSSPAGLLGAQDLQHVLGGQRLEIEPVGGVVVGRHGLRVAVDHDRFEAGVAQREGGMAAAIVELDALADAVRPAAEDDHLLASRDLRLVGECAGERRLVGRVHVGGRRGEFGGAGVDALEHRMHVELFAQSCHVLGVAPAPARPAARRKSPCPSACADSRRPRAGHARGCGLPWPGCRRSARGTTGRSCTWRARLRARCPCGSPAPPCAAGRASACPARRGWRCGRRRRHGRGRESRSRRGRSGRSPARAAPSAAIPGRCGRSPSPRRPTSWRWSAPARRRGISRRQSAGSWSRRSRSHGSKLAGVAPPVMSFSSSSSV